MKSPLTFVKQFRSLNFLYLLIPSGLVPFRDTFLGSPNNWSSCRVAYNIIVIIVWLVLERMFLTLQLRCPQ